MVAGLILPVAGLAVAGLVVYYVVLKTGDVTAQAALGPFGDRTIWVLAVGTLGAAALIWVAVR